MTQYIRNNAGTVKLYLLFVLIFAQLIPTFGDILGSPGNGIPLGVGFLGFGFGFFIYLSYGLPRKFFLSVTLFFLFVLCIVTFSNIISPFGQVVRDLSIYVKLFTVYFAFICGYAFFTKQADLKTLFIINLCILGFHILLYFDHLIDPNGPIQKLYHYKALVGGYGGYGKNRFPGTWNFPYNETIFLFASAMSVFYMGFRKQTPFKIVFILLGFGALYISMFGTQSRSGFIGVFVCGFYGIILYALISVFKNRARSFGFSLLWLLFIGLIGVAVFTYLQLDTTAGDFRHLAKLMAEPGSAADKRLEEVDSLFQNQFADHPFNFIFGFGVARGSGIYVESLLNYLFNFGILGFVSIMGAWIYIWGKLLAYAFFAPNKQVSTGFLMANIAVFYMFIIGSSSDIFLHYRFIPYYYFLTGVVFKYMQILKYQHMEPRP